MIKKKNSIKNESRNEYNKLLFEFMICKFKCEHTENYRELQ